MSVTNKKIVKKIIEVFANSDNNLNLCYLDDDIRWNIVGMPAISGKSDFIKTINSLELENFRLSNIRNILSEGEFVVVESTNKLVNKLSVTNYTAYCDIYRIKNEKVYELTTYIVDISSDEKADKKLFT